MLDAQKLCETILTHNGTIHGHTACLYLMDALCEINTVVCTFHSTDECIKFTTFLMSVFPDAYQSYNHFDKQWDMLIGDEAHLIISLAHHKPTADFDMDLIELRADKSLRFHNLFNLQEFGYIMARRFKPLTTKPTMTGIMRAKRLYEHGWRMRDDQTHWTIKIWEPLVHKTCPFCGHPFGHEDVHLHLTEINLNMHLECFVSFNVTYV